MNQARTRIRLPLTLIILGLVSTVHAPFTPSAASGRLPTAAQDQIDAYIEARMRAANIPGLALGIVHGTEITYLQGYGRAGADGRAVTPQTPFILGSTSKSFTALAIMQLVEAGQIDLEAPVTRYLPWFHTADAAASAHITVRQLLHQNSGLPVYAGRMDFGDDDQSASALEAGVRRLTDVQLNHPAGEAYEYANENYTILGQIIQAVTADSYEAYIRSHLFAPLHMTHSAAALSDPAAQDLAAGHRYWLWWPIAFEAPYPRAMTPAGFLIASAEDMTHYLIAQLNGGQYQENRVLSAPGLAQLHAAGASVGRSAAYAMGWLVSGAPGSTRLDHSGDVSNFHSNLLLLPDQQIGIVILINVNGLNNAAALNVPIEGVAALLVGEGLSAAVDPPVDWLTPALLLLPLLIAAVWIIGSYRGLRRWQRRGEWPGRGWPLLWRYLLPLAIDVGLAGAAWMILPRQFQTPMAVISLFVPDVFLIVLLVTALGLGWAIVRTLMVFGPPRPVRSASPT